jgi:hypothetical protein
VTVNLQQLEKDGVYEANSKIVEILADLDRITGMVRDAAAQKRQKVKLGGLLILAGGIGVLAGAVMGASWLLPLSMLVGIGGLALCLYSLFNKGKLLRHPQRLEITRERLSMIQADAAEKPFTLRLALASQPVNVRGEVWHGRKNGHQEFSEETWLSLEGPLLDGCILTGEIIDLYRKRTYVNPRGKHKTKSRVTHLVNISFCYPRDRYGDACVAHQALGEEVKTGPSALLRKTRVTEKAISLRAMVNTEQEIARTAGMLSMGAYRILNLARRMAERKGGSPQ